MTTTAAQKCHSRWVEGHRNHGSSSGWSQSIGVTWSVSRDWPINWARRRLKQRNFQCYRGWHRSFKVEVFGGYPTWLQFWKRFRMGKWRWNWFWMERIWRFWRWTAFITNFVLKLLFPWNMSTINRLKCCLFND